MVRYKVNCLYVQEMYLGRMEVLFLLFFLKPLDLFYNYLFTMFKCISLVTNTPEFLSFILVIMVRSVYIKIYCLSMLKLYFSASLQC